MSGLTPTIRTPQPGKLFYPWQCARSIHLVLIILGQFSKRIERQSAYTWEPRLLLSGIRLFSVSSACLFSLDTPCNFHLLLLTISLKLYLCPNSAMLAFSTHSSLAELIIRNPKLITPTPPILDLTKQSRPLDDALIYSHVSTDDWFLL